MTDRVEIGGESRLKVPEHVLSRRAGDETVLLNLDNEEYYGLDGVGDRLWQLIAGGDATFGSVTEALLGEFDVERDVLERDLAVVVRDMVSNGLLIVDAP